MKSSDFVAHKVHLLLSKQTLLLRDSERLTTFLFLIFIFYNFLGIENTHQKGNKLVSLNERGN